MTNLNDKKQSNKKWEEIEKMKNFYENQPLGWSLLCGVTCAMGTIAYNDGDLGLVGVYLGINALCGLYAGKAFWNRHEACKDSLEQTK